VEFPRDTESYLQLALKLDKSDKSEKVDLAEKVASGAL
jgi:hypothetical protein